jgi:hypothetical protein
MSTRDAPATPPHATDAVTIVLPRRFVEDALTDLVALEEERGGLPLTLTGMAVTLTTATW